MENLTPEQKKQIDSWVSQRDTILLEIANKKTESEKLTAINKDIASSNTEIADKIQQSIGRLAELDKQEEERAKFTTIENATLIVEKSTLQTEISSLKSEVVVLIEQKLNLYSDIKDLTKIYETVFTRTSDIERIISETITLNNTNTNQIKNILVEAGIELKKIIDISEKNVETTNKAINEIPKMIVEIHKDVIERRTFNKKHI